MEAKSEVEPRKTPFHDLLVGYGGQFAEYDGALYPDTFGDFEAEYKAQRENFGIFDCSPVNKWEFRGPDATTAAQRVHTNAIGPEAIGQLRYGAFCDAEGLVYDDGTVYKLADDHLWVMTNKKAGRAELFAEATEGLDVEIRDITDELPHLYVQGPASRDALTPLTEADLSELGYFRFTPDRVSVAGVPIWLSRSGVSGELGYELFCRPEDAPDLLRNLVERTGGRLYGLQAIDPVRVEAGIIVTDYDYPEHVYTPYDLGLDRTVDLSQDFLGRDALIVVEREPRKRQLTTVRLSSEDLPESGAELVHGGAGSGALSSPTVSPLFGPIALAIIKAELASPGTEFQIAGTSITATVNDTHPAYDPEKKRPRA
jgi:aminomethyltransferase